MIDSIERYVFTLSANYVDLIAVWAQRSKCSPQELLWRFITIGAAYAAAKELERPEPVGEQLIDPAYLAEDLLPALRERWQA